MIVPTRVYTQMTNIFASFDLKYDSANISESKNKTHITAANLSLLPLILL